MAYAIYPSLKDRTVVVTGGGTGIGAAMVQAFSHQSARVYFLDVAQEASISLRNMDHFRITPARFLMDFLARAATNSTVDSVAA
ncbi:hypothetical protein [Paraburkholderia sp. HD33-4]|uniref:hypothetical protein n=1 Tax=Paraburkholderia sp. HD33-4 TaxID=2883242 RepID=UPI003FA3561B